MTSNKVEPMHIEEASMGDNWTTKHFDAALNEPPVESLDNTVQKKNDEEATKEEAVKFEELPPSEDFWYRLCVRLRLLSTFGGDNSDSGSSRCGRLVGLSKRMGLVILALGYTVYLSYCIFLMATRFRGTPEAEQSIRLIWVSAIAAVLLAIHWSHRCECLNLCRSNITVNRAASIWRRFHERFIKRVLRPAATYWWLAEGAIVVSFLCWMAAEKPDNLVSAAGALVLLLLSLAISVHPDRVNWKPVLGGIVIQVVFSALILRTEWGFAFFNFLGDRTTEFVHHCEKGSKFLFGDKYKDHYFAFVLLPVVVYFSSILSVLFHLGVLQAVICKVGSFMQVIMGTTAAESMVAAANIFVGQTEAPLMVRPFLKLMTNSEIHSVMTSGFATMTGGILAAYISMGVPARHLLSASVMSAPAALAISKLVYPETRKSQTQVADVRRVQLMNYGSIIEAVSMGAVASLPIVGAIAVNLIAFISILAFVNSTLTWFGYRAGLEFPLTFEYIMSFLFWPLALVMGVSPRDCRQVGELIGIKTFINEFVAYERFTAIKHNYRAYQAALGNATELDYRWVGTDVLIPSVNLTLRGGLLFEDKSLVITTYSLCGFSNLGSIGILIGALSAMAPARQSDIASCALRAMAAGSVACFLTACIAGLLFTDSDQVLF